MGAFTNDNPSGRMIRSLILIFFLTIGCNTIFASTNNVTETADGDSAKVVKKKLTKQEKVFAKAREEADAGKAEEALVRLEKYSKGGDTSSIAIEYLKVKCYYQLQKYDEAKSHLATYFVLEKDTANDDYREMKAVSSQLKVKVDETYDSRDTAGLVGGGFDEQKTWDYASRTNNVNAYRNYIKFFPRGPHIEDAKKAVEYYDKKENNPSKLVVDAVRKNDMALLKELLAKGADVNYVEVRKNTVDRTEGKVNEYYFETALSVALMRFDYNTAKYLLELGADPNRFMYRKVYEYDKKIGRTRSILENMVMATSKSGIYSAQDSRLIDLIDLMLHYGLDLDFYQGSPIYTSVYFHDAKKFKKTLLVRYLLRKGADPYLHGEGPLDKSAIQIARERGDKAMVAILRDKKYKPARKKYQDNRAKGITPPIPKPAVPAAKPAVKK